LGYRLFPNNQYARGGVVLEGIFGGYMLHLNLVEKVLIG
jgi:hypothetical protein